VYRYAPHLEQLLETLAAMECRTLMLCRGVDAALRAKFSGSSVYLAEVPMAASRLLEQADLVVCHGSHQMTAQSLLAGKPLLLLPSQLEQFLITRRVVRFGAGLGIALDVAAPDFRAALNELVANPGYGAKAREFAQRYAGHDRDAALKTMIARCESAACRARDT
jgi:UDP:flavonoid glycosyltransferase YjiC (YdhE family)